MTRKIFVVHGFNVSDGGARSIDRLVPALKQVDNADVYQADYGWRGVLGVIHRNDNTARQIKALSNNGSIGIGHSNGCAILTHAARYGATLDKLIFINPALKPDVEIPTQVKEVHVFHTKHDIPVLLAKYLKRVIFWRKTFLWGEMGRTGYTGNDPRVINHDISDRAKGHSKIFSSYNIKWLQHQVRKICTQPGTTT